MSRAHTPNFPSLHLRLNSCSNPSVALPKSQLITQSLPLLHLRHSSIPNPSFACPTSQALHVIHLATPVTLSTSPLILQSFRRFTYVTDHSTLPLLHLRHSLFSNPSFASPTSQVLHLIHLASRPRGHCIMNDFYACDDQ